jgi:hypothetical protein
MHIINSKIIKFQTFKLWKLKQQKDHTQNQHYEVLGNENLKTFKFWPLAKHSYKWENKWQRIMWKGDGFGE